MVVMESVKYTIKMLTNSASFNVELKAAIQQYQINDPAAISNPGLGDMIHDHVGRTRITVDYVLDQIVAFCEKLLISEEIT